MGIHYISCGTPAYFLCVANVRACFGFGSILVLSCAICRTEISPFITRCPILVTIDVSDRTLAELGAFSRWVKNYSKIAVITLTGSRYPLAIVQQTSALFLKTKACLIGSISATNPLP